jgi:hypothetical protein
MQSNGKKKRKEIGRKMGKKHESARKNLVKKEKVRKVIHEFEHGDLHSGSKKGYTVTNPKQAIAIALSEARRGKKK